MVRTVAVVGNVTHRHDVVIDKKKHVIWKTLFEFVVFIIKSYSLSK